MGYDLDGIHFLDGRGLVQVLGLGVLDLLGICLFQQFLHIHVDHLPLVDGQLLAFPADPEGALDLPHGGMELGLRRRCGMRGQRVPVGKRLTGPQGLLHPVDHLALPLEDVGGIRAHPQHTGLVDAVAQPLLPLLRRRRRAEKHTVLVLSLERADLEEPIIPLRLRLRQ